MLNLRDSKDQWQKTEEGYFIMSFIIHDLSLPIRRKIINNIGMNK